MKTFQSALQSLWSLRLFIPALAIGFMVGLPHLAQAQSGNRAAPQIDVFTVDAASPVAPGSDIDFTVEGTPKGQVSVRITGINRTIALREVSPGVYEGAYTVSRRDQLGAKPTARATLRVRGNTSTATQAFAGAAAAAAPVAAAAAAAPGLPVIERFGVTQVAKIEPGVELRFNANGTPGGRALLNIDGVAQNIAMPEVKPGRYEGGYTIRRTDNIAVMPAITVALEVNGQVARSKLTGPLVDPRVPTVKNLSPKNNEMVTSNPVSVSATFDDMGGVGIDPKTVKLTIGGVDKTPNASITQQFLTWRGELRPGIYPVEVTAADNAGRAIKQAWTFSVASAQAPAAAAAALTLEITSHPNNAQVPAGRVDVKGRTVPDTKVDVQVQAIASLAGVLGVNQQILNQSIRSDAQGNFAFSFQPQLPVPGLRFEATITASRGEQTKETRLVLFQQR